MKKVFVLLSLIFLLNGCVESVALLSSTVGGASSGRIVQSSLNTALSYGIKQQTGKTPLGHALAYAEEKNPEKKKEACVSFIEKTRSEFCAVVKKQITLTNDAIKEQATLIVKKIPNLANTGFVKSVLKSKNSLGSDNKPKPLDATKKRDLTNSLNRIKKSPKPLTSRLQAVTKKISDNKFLSSNLLKR